MADEQYATESEFQQLLARYNKLEKYVQLKIMGNDPSTNWGLLPLIVQQQGPFAPGSGNVPAPGADGTVLTADSGVAAGMDWEPPISLTTVGTSGAAVLTPPGVPGIPYNLNIPQYTGGGGSGYTLISGQVLVGAAVSVTFASIPGTFNNLALVVAAQSNNGSQTDNVLGTINGATETGTCFFLALITNIVSSSISHNSSSDPIIGIISGSTAVAQRAGYFIANMSAYKNTTWERVVNTQGSYDAGTSGLQIYQLALNHDGIQAAISSMVLTLQSGAFFKAGSAFYLYGY